MSTNKLILGTVQLGLDYGINNNSGKPSQDDAYNILDVAYKSGIRCLDTATAYGNSEEIIGAFHENSKQNFSVFTKFHVAENSDISSLLTSSLNKLSVNVIDVLFFHSYQDFKANPKMLSELTNEVDKGNIKKIGVSVYTNKEVEDLLNYPEVEVVQVPFNLLDNEGRRGEVFSKAKRQGKEIHTRSAFLQGVFFKDVVNMPNYLLPLRKALKEIQHIAIQSNLRIASLALNYALSKPYIDRVLFGVENVRQLKSNLIATKDTLPSEIEEAIDAISVDEPRLLNPALWSK